MNYCYIHYLISSDGGLFSHEIFDSIFQQIRDSGLLNSLEKIKVFTVGDSKKLKTNFFQYEKTFHAGHHDDVYSYEFPTLELIATDAKTLEPDDKILYLHTKNASKPFMKGGLCSWTRSMLNFVVQQYNLCFELMKTHDTVGAFFSEVYSNHYSGNFWWSHVHHINKLPHPNVENFNKNYSHLVKNRNNKNPCSPASHSHRYYAEYWIGLLGRQTMYKGHKNEKI